MRVEFDGRQWDTDDLISIVRLAKEALQDGPFVVDRDGYYDCWFCGGDGSWEPDSVEHEVDCVWVKIETLINPEFAAQCAEKPIKFLDTPMLDTYDPELNNGPHHG